MPDREGEDIQKNSICFNLKKQTIKAKKKKELFS